MIESMPAPCLHYAGTMSAPCRHHAGTILAVLPWGHSDGIKKIIFFGIPLFCLNNFCRHFDNIVTVLQQGGLQWLGGSTFPLSFFLVLSPALSHMS